MGLLKSLAKDAVNLAKETAAEAAITAAAAGVVVASAAAVEGVKSGVKAVEKGINSVGETVEKVIGDSDERHYKKEQRYLSKKKKNGCLFVQRFAEKKDAFVIYDIDQKARYSCIGNIEKKTFILDIYDGNNTKIAIVYKANNSRRGSLFHEKDPADYVIQMGNTQSALVKTVLSEKKYKYEVEPQGWVVKENSLNSDIVVLDGKETVLNISKRKGYDKETYIIDYSDSSNELLFLLISMVIICIN